MAKDAFRTVQDAEGAIKSENTTSMLSKMAQRLFSGGGSFLKRIVSGDEEQQQKENSSASQSQTTQNPNHTQQNHEIH